MRVPGGAGFHYFCVFRAVPGSHDVYPCLPQGEFLEEGEEPEEVDEDEWEEEPDDDYQQYSKVGRGMWGDEEVEFEVRGFSAIG